MAALMRDPVCGKEVDSLRARAVGIWGGRTYYFCSPEHKAEFARDPAAFGEHGAREPTTRAASPAATPASGRATTPAAGRASTPPAGRSPTPAPARPATPPRGSRPSDDPVAPSPAGGSATAAATL